METFMNETLPLVLAGECGPNKHVDTEQAESLAKIQRYLPSPDDAWPNAFNK